MGSPASMGCNLIVILVPLLVSFTQLSLNDPQPRGLVCSYIEKHHIVLLKCVWFDYLCIYYISILL